MDTKKIICLIFIGFLSSFNVAHGWTIKMDFNDGPLGQSVEDKSQSDYHVFSDAAGDTLFSPCTGIAIGGQCAQMNIKKGHNGWGVWGGRINFAERGVANPGPGDEVWISVKIYFPVGFDYAAMPHLKFLRLHTRSAGTENQNEGYNDLYITPNGPTHWDASLGKNSDAPFFYIKEFHDVRSLFGDFDTDRPKLGHWETYEVYLKLDSKTVAEGGSSKVRVWKNGILLADLDGIQTLVSQDSYADAFLIFTYWNGGNDASTGDYPTKDQSVYVDDLTITTDTPSSTDRFGNPMIGDVILRPTPPSTLVVE